MKYRQILILTFLIGLVAGLVPYVMAVQSNNEYVGGFFKNGGNKYTTDKAIMGNDWDNITEGEMKYIDDWVPAVLSVAGGNQQGDWSGYVYQNPIHLVRDDSGAGGEPLDDELFWNPQIWYDGNFLDNKGFLSTVIGTVNYTTFYVEIRGLSDGYANYKAYAYDTMDQLINNNPYVYTWETDYYSGDSKYLVGTDQGGGETLKFFQFGVEEASGTTWSSIGGEWRISNYNMGYYDSSTNDWRYLPGYSVQHEDSWITEVEGSPYYIGGQNYDGVHIDDQGSDFVMWQYVEGGSTVGSGVGLWSGEGTYIPDPYR
ncbi:hypothetical protein AKJ41_02840 [candidate division MSBL1 archaeon SCGC-AAA259O05]|uniref:Uncharacterized protein n=1 Tax=candidate division MSBL1 archaeon SCGC-AAA259O05 TaxID=1698271 RepID=A0A133V3Q4_9EURY|nr:hypothetical protein AKJ41_02840 [candidate division MSBL1 archaeon SCGC-AAA259O05]